MKKKLNKEIIFLGIIILLLILLRTPALFEPHWDPSEGNFSALAYQLQLGKDLYKDLWTSLPPGIFSIYFVANMISSYSIFALKGINLIFSILSVVLIFKISSKLLGPKTGLISALFSTLLLGLPVIGANIASPETFSTFFVLLGLYELCIGKPLNYLIAGVSFGTATVFNLFVIPEIILLLAFFIVVLRRGKNQLLALSLGFLVPILLGIFYLIKNDIFDYFLHNALVHNLSSMLTSPQGGLGFVFFPSTFFLRSLVVIISIMFFISQYKSKKISQNNLLITFWAFIACYSALLHNTSESHLLIQIVPVFSILTTRLLLNLVNAKNSKEYIPKLFLFISTILVFLNLFTSGKRIYSPISMSGYYSNFIKYLTGTIDTTSYVKFFGEDVYQTYRFNTYLSQNYSDIRNIYVWADNPWIYRLYTINAPSRYLTSQDACHQFGEVKSDLTKNSPDLVVIDRYSQDSSELEKFLEENNFEESTVFENYQIYEPIAD
ncbi:MAG: hypothetical protein ABIE03_04945 [Patescibacteria group bacterium]|nr:glycosyltransferase family 39 protein [Patescibacteria group bacterium]